MTPNYHRARMRRQWRDGWRLAVGGWRGHVLAIGVFVVLAVVNTWPLAMNLDRAVSDPGDPFINTWVLDWDYWAAWHQPLSLFDANTFYPARLSLAFSENLVGVAVLLFPLRVMGVSALTAYNVAMLGGFAFCGIAMYLLALRLTRSFAAALAAGVFYAFVPFRFVHLSHVQHVWGGWLPMMLFALLLYGERPTRRRAIFFAAMFVMNGLTNIHYLFFGALATAITAALLIRREAWRELLIATIVAIAILAPFLYPYAAVAKLYGMQRSVTEVTNFSATLSDWLPHVGGEPERHLYPGALAMLVGVAALVLHRREFFAQRALAMVWIAIGVIGSLGFHTPFHEFLFGAVPGFRAIRVPARWAVIAYIGLGILIAITTAAIARRSRIVAWLVPIAFVATLWRAPIRWYLTDPQPSPVYTWLATQKLKGGVVELPMDANTSDYEAMFRATVHHQKIANGVSGFSPPIRVALSELSNATPVSDAFVDQLHDANIELVIVHGDILGGRSAEVRAWLQRELDRGRLSFVQRFDTKVEGDWVFRVTQNATRVAHRELDAFLRGASTCNAFAMMGALDFPPPAFTYRTGNAIFSGWAVSHHGIASVDLWFDNRRVKIPARMQSEEALNVRCAGENVTRTRYVAVLDDRPANIDRDTDVQAEVTDGRGVKTVFDHRWITWNAKGSQKAP